MNLPCSRPRLWRLLLAVVLLQLVLIGAGIVLVLAGSWRESARRAAREPTTARVHAARVIEIRMDWTEFGEGVWIDVRQPARLM